MEKIKIRINGFGRIGAYRKINDDEIVGINDFQDVDDLAYLLKYDSTHGTLDGVIEGKDNLTATKRPI